MTTQELNDNFGLAGVLAFHEDQGGLTRAVVTTPACQATVYLHGAHLTAWQPAGTGPVIFLSPQSKFEAGEAIRGGIPVCWPWFGPRWDGGPGKAHGFARLKTWEVAFAALSGEDIHLTLRLGPDEETAALGYPHFQLAMEFTLGRKLKVRLRVANPGPEPLVFEEALHSYFAVADVRKTTLEGLEDALYLDKTDGLKEKETPSDPLVLTGETDRVFPRNVVSVTIGDAQREIMIDKSNSATTVVWNPWAEKAAGLADLGAEAWTGFVCVETANTGADRITLPATEFHGMDAEIVLIPKA